ncbi:polyhydroxyalkanoic acid system family protein [Qipengyuania spongiae]|uniref:Polyhydroxyalkanoic acid system family protein n=1 Tax=Qipengyuania spongiae TaxID=2909673 RepID=A0ABY5T1H7_9SPHN|nr:polyhydroxyalkanoic acid system family protein [Qipengyuania spongiae]UVI40364.1 polyhydroxyalkanoic acid system family protein [Qipengyuania spongiae]
MRVPIAHDLPKEEVRRRLRDRSHEIANFVPGGMAEVTTGWPDEDHMTLGVRAMGQGIAGQVIIEDRQVIFEVDLPPALSFVEPMVAGAIREKGQKLLAPK